MLRQTIHKSNKHVRAGVIALLMLWGMVCLCEAGNYIRLNADFSYARDLVRAGAAAPGESMSLGEARQWIGGGKTEPVSSSNGFAPAIGAGYRYTRGLLIIDAGLGVEYRSRYNRPGDITDVKAAAVDNTRLDYIGHHTWSGRETHFEHAAVTLPVMVGLEWHRVYAMAGIKAGVDVWGRSTEKGGYTLRAEYPRYMDILANLPTHGYVENEPYEMPVKPASMVWNLRVCAEVGCCLSAQGKNRKYSSKQSPRYYIGAFAEYGIAGAENSYLPLLAGIRLTALLPLPEPHVCKCMEY